MGMPSWAPRGARGVGYEPFVGLLEETLKSGEAQTSEIVWPDQRAFSVSFTPIEAGGCVAILNDVSRFKVLEQAKNNFIPLPPIV